MLQLRVGTPFDSSVGVFQTVNVCCVEPDEDSSLHSVEYFSATGKMDASRNFASHATTASMNLCTIQNKPVACGHLETLLQLGRES